MRTLLFAVSLLFAVPSAHAQSSITLGWDPSPATDVAGYILSWGTQPGTLASSLDVGKQTEWTVNGLDAHQNYYFTVQAYNAARDLSAPAPPVTNNGIKVQSGGVTADDRPSLFWRNGATGELFTWHLAGDAVIETRAISMVASDTDWTVGGTGDFNGDGFSDLLWRHKDGWLAVWYLQNNQVTYTGYLSINRMPDPGWRIAGVGDTNGDRHADVLWQHADGQLGVWFLHGTTVLSTQYLSIPLMTDPQWKIAAVGDLNNDGMADLVWRATDGWLATWLLEGTTVTQTQFFSIDRMSDPNWQIVAAGATSATAPPALVWRHSGDGSVALWYVKGASVLNTVFTKPHRVADLDWKIVGAR
ncbi:hypothetical protein BH24ACI5_BH24ACI5_08010 [soil metagenome]